MFRVNIISAREKKAFKRIKCLQWHSKEILQVNLTLRIIKAECSVLKLGMKDG